MIGTVKQLIKFLLDQNKDKLFEIKEYKPKRSLNANNFAWKLITAIGNETRQSKETVYLTMLKRYGQEREEVFIRSDVNLEQYEIKNYEKISTGKLGNVDYTHYAIYRGSSTFDTKEMSIFIDGIVGEAEDLGLPTLEDYKIEKMVEAWKK